MTEAQAEPDSETVIELVHGEVALWICRLQTVTGRKHQLRVHLAALAGPLLHTHHGSLFGICIIALSEPEPVMD